MSVHQPVVEWAQDRADYLDRDYFQDPPTDGPGEFVCEECSRRCTRSPTSGIEYGHSRGTSGNRDRCSQRPDVLDTPGGFSGVGPGDTE